MDEKDFQETDDYFNVKGNTILMKFYVTISVIYPVTIATLRLRL